MGSPVGRAGLSGAAFIVALLITQAGCGTKADGGGGGGGGGGRDKVEAGPTAEVPTENAHGLRVPSPEETADLPEDDGDRWNRLVFEKSPYLLQHAANPVEWYPWGDEAFAAARAQDKPIFLSIGYSTCHWCHVMERESFEDEEVARLLNESFISIKVDREERPDVDQVYMAVTQAMTGSGGWPMTVILTPGKEPFFAGTYFPKVGRGQRPGLMELLPQIRNAWETKREDVDASADRIVTAIREQAAGGAGGDLDEGALTAAFKQLSGRYDATRGGFGQAPKFPVPHNLRFLLRHHRRTGDAAALAMTERTLEAMRLGGIYDHVGFGFHRYSTDSQWLLPHFEKMLYDQALLALAYTEAWQVTDRSLFRQTAEEVLAFVLREMTSPEGGFYSAFDADSEGEEGLFYLWTPQEIRSALDGPDAELVVEVFGVVEGGNFLDQATGGKTGRSILHLDRPLKQIADAKGASLDDLRARLERGREELYRVRKQRVSPLLDDKVLTDWNGLMISAMAVAGQAFGEERYTEAAVRAAAFIRAHLVDNEGRLLKRYRDGEAAHPAILEDYAFLIGGLLDIYEATFDAEHLQWAIELEAQMTTHFEDAVRGGFYLSADDGEDLFVRAKEVYDGAIPSGNSAAVLDLARLARLTGDMSYEDRGWRAIRAFSAEVARAPVGHTHFLLGLDFLVGPSYEIVVAGQRESRDSERMVGALRARFLPNKVVLFRGAGVEDPIVDIAEFTALQTALDGKATVYVCRDFVCRLPTHDVQEMLRSLGESTQ
jgi:hypothetical protein